jgi:diguanylate cyclase (GGDEF)-like protein
VFGRLGGEEFAAILPVANAARAREVANRILDAFEVAGQNLAHAGLEITASAGLAISGEGASSFDDLFAAADRALYKAKRTGRNRTEEDTSNKPVNFFELAALAS